MRRLLCTLRYKLLGRWTEWTQRNRAQYYKLFFDIGRDVKLADGVRLWGQDIRIGSHVTLDWDTCLIGPVTLGNGIYINQQTIISQQVTIEDNVGIGPGCTIFGDSRQVSDNPDCRAGDSTWHPTIIGKGAMIGAQVTVLPGVHVGPGAVIAAGSVVIDDCEPNAVYAGVPAKKVKDLSHQPQA
jgi:acetyltransferase-like isoleucine patch superfamily enzyme